MAGIRLTRRQRGAGTGQILLEKPASRRRRRQPAVLQGALELLPGGVAAARRVAPAGPGGRSA